MNSLFDTHCHLDLSSLEGATAVLSRAKEHGVTSFMNVAVDLKSSSQIGAFSEQLEDVIHSVGVHPHEAKELTEEALARLRAWSMHPECKAIGEIGIDCHYLHSSKEEQIQALNLQLGLAVERKLPVIIHSRNSAENGEAEEDLYTALKAYSSHQSEPGIIHCFSGTYEFGKKCLDLGFYLSLSGILTFKTAEILREAVEKFPLERLLVETDSPYLAPVPFRGKPCEPYMVRWTAEKLAELKKVSLSELAEITTTNARKVFNLDGAVKESAKLSI